MKANVLSVHPQPLGWGQKVKYSTLSEYGHVADQIKRNDMVVNNLPTEGSKGQQKSESSHIA